MNKEVIIVLGAPRSGTSVISHLLNKLGVDFGDYTRFVDPSVHQFNPIFFELQSLNNLNDDIFKYFSKEYAEFNWLPMEKDFNEEVVFEFENKIINLIESEFEKESPLIGLKDPRFCFTLPLWDEILKKNGFIVRYLLTQRNSSAVFASNKKENKFSSETNFRLVALSVLLARRFLKQKKFTTVRYENVISDTKLAVLNLCKEFDLDSNLIEDACLVVQKELNHHLKAKNTYNFKYFESRIDKDIAHDEYIMFREIFFSACVMDDDKKFFSNLDLTMYDLNINKLEECNQSQLKYINQLENKLVETEFNSRQLKNEILRAEAQIELLKDILLSGKLENI